VKRFQLVTFDVYTALFDIEGSLTPHVAAALGRDADGLAVVREWRRRQMELVLIGNSLQQARLSFDRITRLALDDTLARTRRDLPDRTRMELVRAWRMLDPWPEARDALVAARARGCAMGLLSNGDEDMLQALLLKLPVVFDHMFSSEEAGCYKPHPAVYALPLQRLALRADQVLHVAGSVTDVIGTKAAGLSCIWSNRRGEPLLDPRFAPDHEVAHLGGVPALLE
jgi:2-haloacid dehalogenase